MLQCQCPCMCGVHTSLDASVSHCPKIFKSFGAIYPSNFPSSSPLLPRTWLVLDRSYIYLYIFNKNQKTPSVLYYRSESLSWTTFLKLFPWQSMGFCIGNGNQGSHSWSLCQINIGQKILVPFNHGVSLGHCCVYAADLPRIIVVRNIRCQWGVEQWFLLS